VSAFSQHHPRGKAVTRFDDKTGAVYWDQETYSETESRLAREEHLRQIALADELDIRAEMWSMP
jgi:hypothetical protein